MINKPLVSVIIIFLDEERFIREAIDSVFLQTYGYWELLLVDDGSTDGSTEIAQEYAAQYPHKIYYLEHNGHANRGMNASRNLGVRHATGKYISYLDGDDVWLPHKLEQQVAILESQPQAAMVYGPLYEWYSWTGKPEDLNRDDLFGFGEKRAHPYADTLVAPPNLLPLFLRDERFIPGGMLLDRMALERLGGNEESFRGNHSDTVTLVKICLTVPVFVSSQVWYKYRIHPESYCRMERRLGKSDATRRVYLNWVEAYLLEQGVTDREIWRALRRAQRRRLYRLLDVRRHLSRLESLRSKWRGGPCEERTMSL